MNLHKQQYHYETDPFIEPMIKSICYNRLKDVKTKFRIKDEFCCNLIGVLDPYHVLQPGEVFIQFNPYIKSEEFKECVFHTNITGQVLVTRSPCVHPGDIRILHAIDKKEVPELENYVNVIVFSCLGDRPDNNKMGSGDLDGDIYWINWNPTFLNSYIEQDPDLPDVESDPIVKDDLLNKAIKGISKFLDIDQSNDKNIEEVDLISNDEDDNRTKCIDNFINYIKNDILGQVANLHIKIADLDKLNVRTDE